MFPDAARLRRLLDYLSIHPLSIVLSLDEVQIINPAAGDKLTQESLGKIDRIRKAVYNFKNYNQIGLFEFRVGLILMEREWFSEAAESFRKAAKLWSFLPERPNICLANFANGVAHHRNRRFDLAEQLYSEVQEQIVRIREEVTVPSSIPQVKKYQDFVKDLTAQLEEAQKTMTRDIFHDLSPRIHPSLQSDSHQLSSTQLLKVNQEILQANIQRHFNTAELQALCFELKIDFNALDGQGMANKARELVAYCVRNRRVSAFLQELSKRNPSVSWEDNILQPSPEEVIQEEPGEAAGKAENVVEGQFEELDSAEKGLEFVRTEMGKIQFPQEEDRVRPISLRMVIVNVELSGNFSNFSLEEQNHFVHFISKITDIDPDQITLLEVMAGSIKVTLEMPEGSAKQLIGMLLEKNPILTNFRILKVELGELVGPPAAEAPIVNASPDLLQKVIPAKLEQFIFLYFNDKELRELYFGVDVDYDSLPGHGKQEKAVEIVAFCSRHKKFDQLARLCRDKRPAAFVKAFA
jgi:tetratricopeptide (TPR) repeat protein